jgi:hypothetical protein
MVRKMAAALVLALQLVACGGGGSSGSSSTNPPATTAPSDLSYPSAPTFAVGAAITPLTPTVTGTVTSYTVSPALPAGLALNATTGVISGTPSAVAAKTSYTVTASNSAGSTSASVSLEVTGVTPAFTYQSLVITLTLGTAVNLAPTSTGGAVSTWSVTPALPAGVTIDAATGTISGTPSTATLPANYVVTAENSAGSAKVGLTIAVVSGTLLDLGHANTVSSLLLSGTAALSKDAGLTVDQESISRCNLWNTTTDTLVMSLACYGQVALAGPTAVVASNAGFGGGLRVLSSSSGALQATIRTPYSWYQLASDGSYIVLGSSSGLTAYSPTGATLFSAGGDYSKAQASAAPGKVLIALGPKGDDVIETVTVPGGTSSTGTSFEGTFNEWFVDGSHFQTLTGLTVRTYSTASVQQDITSLTSVVGLNGTGNYFWTNTSLGVFDLFAVGSSSATLLTLNNGFGATAIAGGTTVAVLPASQAQATLIDLSGASPVQHPYTLPASMVNPTAYGATSASQWFVGSATGAILDGTTLASTPKYPALGKALSISGGNSLVAIATASGEIVVINAATHAVQTTLNFLSGNVQMSADGTVLAASGLTNFTAQQPDETLNVYSIPSGTVIHSFPYTFGSGTQLTGYTLAPTGTLIAQATSNVSGTTFARQASAVGGGAVLWSDTPTELLPSVQFSPDGTIIAATEGPQAPGTNTNFYGSPNYTLTTAVSGWGVGWVSSTSFLANIYLASSQNSPLGVYGSAKLYSSAGALLSTPALPELIDVEALTSTTAYAPSRNSIYDLSTGQAIFGSGALVAQSQFAGGTEGFVTNGYDVFPFSALVVGVQY